MELIKINPKGQIVIPKKIRADFEITKDSVLAIDKTKNHIVIKKVDTELIDKIKRSFEDIKHGRIKEWKS